MSQPQMQRLHLWCLSYYLKLAGALLLAILALNLCVMKANQITHEAQVVVGNLHCCSCFHS